MVGQPITIDSGANQETTTIALVQGGRGGARITVTAPLKIAHPRGAVVAAELPTPGAANRYSNPRAAR